MSTKSFRNFVGSLRKGKAKPQRDLSYQELLADRYIIVGSPETVKNELGHYCDEVGAGGMVGPGNPYGPMPNWMVMKNMQIAAEEVMPEFREADGVPDYQREKANSQRSIAELAAVKGRPEETARSLVTGGGDTLIEHRLAHVSEVIDPTIGREVAERPVSTG